MSSESSLTPVNDLSTQTDFSPKLSNATFRKLNKIRLESADLHSLAGTLLAKNNQARRIQESMMTGFQRKIRDLRLQFRKLVNSKGQNLISSESSNPDDIDLFAAIESLRRNQDLPRRSKTVELVKRTAISSAKTYSQSSAESSKINFQHCSSQTEISTLLIGLDFDPQLNKSEITVSQLNGQWVNNNACISKLNFEIQRLQWYCDDLIAGKEIIVFESDLLFEEEHTRIERYQSLIDIIKNHAEIILY